VSRLGIEAATNQGLPFDPTQVRYYGEAARALGLVEDEKRAFQKNGFVMVDHGGPLSMGRAYLEVYKADLPVFVSADSLLHALHRSFDGVLKDIEWSVLVPNLQAALAAIEPELCPLARVPGLQESVDDLALFLAVARNLLAGVKPEAQAQLIFPPTCGDPEAVREVLDKISRLRPDQREQPSTVYGGARVIDCAIGPALTEEPPEQATCGDEPPARFPGGTRGFERAR
jgi:hypothetical protein